MLPKKVTIIGAGNLATQLALNLSRLNTGILQVYSRTADAASALAQKIGAQPVTDLSQIDQSADLYIIAVKDDALIDVAAQLQFQDKIVVHTSGSRPLTDISKCSSKTGVFYPLQSFSKNKNINFDKIPVCVEASDNSTEAVLVELADALRAEVYYINSEQRSSIHVAAVFANNFSNHMFAVAKKLLDAQGIDFKILLPLVKETVAKLEAASPEENQTGPAIRNDRKVIETHLQQLQNDQDLQKLYRQITKSILDFHNIAEPKR